MADLHVMKLESFHGVTLETYDKRSWFWLAA